VIGTPTGNEIAGRRHDLVSALLRDVLYYFMSATAPILHAEAYEGHLQCLGGHRVKDLDRTKGLTNPQSRFSRMFIHSIIRQIVSIGHF
jgi:hypothetical protein